MMVNTSQKSTRSTCSGWAGAGLFTHPEEHQEHLRAPGAPVAGGRVKGCQHIQGGLSIKARRGPGEVAAGGVKVSQWTAFPRRTMIGMHAPKLATSSGLPSAHHDRYEGAKAGHEHRRDALQALQVLEQLEEAQHTQRAQDAQSRHAAVVAEDGNKDDLDVRHDHNERVEQVPAVAHKLPEAKTEQLQADFQGEEARQSQVGIPQDLWQRRGGVDRATGPVRCALIAGQTKRRAFGVHQ
eukprot:365420-Chlamydomonas_euryale.AAC.12